MLRFALVALCVGMSSCAELIVREDDNVLQETAKILTRVILVVPTAGISEAAMSEVKDREAYEAWRKRDVPRPVSEKEWRAHLFDEKLLTLSELMPHLIIASWIGDYFTISADMAQAAALLAISDQTSPDDRHYLPPPMRRWNRALDDSLRGPCQRSGPCPMP